MKTLIGIVIFVTSLNSFASNEAVIRSVECVNGGSEYLGAGQNNPNTSLAELATNFDNSGGCSNDEYAEAEARAASLEARLQQRFQSISDSAKQKQTSSCQQSVAKFREECNSLRYSSIQTTIQEIRTTIDSKTKQIGNINKFAQTEANDSNTPSSEIEKLVANVRKLVADIEEAKLTLAEQEQMLANQDQICLVQNDVVANVCREPVVNTENNEIQVVEFTANQSLVIPKAPASEVSPVGNVIAAAKLQVSGPVTSPEIRSSRESAERSFYGTTRNSGTTSESLTQTTTFANSSLAQANSILSALAPLISQEKENFNDNTKNSLCSAIMEARGECSDSQDTTTADTSSVTSDRPGQRPDGLGSQNAGATAPTDGSRRPPASAGNGENRDAVSAKDVEGQALSRAYGGNNETQTAVEGPNGTPAAGGQASGGFGAGISNALGGIGSMFGKTGGGFGSEGYSSSSNSRMGLAGGGQNNAGNYRGKTNGNFPQQNVDFTPKNKNSNANAPTRNSRAFGGGSANAGSGMNNGQSGAMGGAGGMGSGSSGAGSGKNSGEKPNFFNRLLGKKKDKTMFGKTESSGRGGSYASGSRSAQRGYQGRNADGSVNYGDGFNANGERTFDASKYAPSKAAQDRAYARATGRKIASHAPATGSTVEWPSDISRNKNRNMFSNVGLQVKVQINK